MIILLIRTYRKVHEGDDDSFIFVPGDPLDYKGEEGKETKIM